VKVGGYVEFKLFTVLLDKQIHHWKLDDAYLRCICW